MFDDKRNRELRTSTTQNKPTGYSISRREFFKGFIRNITETAEKLVAPDPNVRTIAWMKLGRISEFQPNSVKEINNGKQLLYSTSRGFQAIDNSNEIKVYRPLKLDEHGFLFLDPSGVWPDRGHLALMTGRYQLEMEEML